MPATLITFLTLASLALAVPASASGPSVTIVAPTHGDTVAGVVSVEATTEGDATTVAFDWAPSEAGPWTALGSDHDGADGWVTSWDTGNHTGPAVLRATALDGTTETKDFVSVTVAEAPTVTVQVKPDPFSPNGDGNRDVALLTGSSDTAGTLTISVLGPAGAEKRSWQRTVEPGEPSDVEWNGRADGVLLPDATYTIRAEMDGSGAEAPLTLDTQAPGFAWRKISPEPLTTQDLVHFKFATADRSPKIDVNLNVRDRVRTIGMAEKQVAPGDRQVSWEPAYQGGGPLFPGVYTARLTLKDDAGNIRFSKWKAWRVKRVVGARIYTRLDGAGPRVALTFDDCNFAAAWHRILNTLKSHDVEATFFCTGQAMKAHPDLVRRTVKEGHTISAHAWDHAYLPGHSVSYTASRLKKDAATAWWLAKTTTWPYFRPPYGAHDKNVRKAATATSHPRVVLWDVDPRDWERPGPAVIKHRVLKEIKKGSIVVLHVIGQTATALPGLLNALEARGLRQVDLPNLFQAAGFK